MINLTISIFKNTMKRNVIKVIFVTCTIPLVIFVASLFNDEFLIIQGTNVSLISFINLVFTIMHTIFIPLALIVQLSVLLFYDEKQKRTYHFYKDISRRKIYIAKFISIFIVYVLYCILLLFILIFIYYVLLSNDVRFSHNIWENGDRISVMVTFITILSDLVIIQVGVLLSIKYNSAYTIMGTFLYYILSTISHMFGFLGILFVDFYTFESDLSKAYLSSIILFMMISMIIQRLNLKAVNKVEY